MDLLRPKSGILRIKDGQQKQGAFKYKHRNLSKQICKSINILPIRIHHHQSIQRLGSENEMIKTMNCATSKQGFGSNQQLKKCRKNRLSIKSKNSIKIDDDDYTNNYILEDEVVTWTSNKFVQSNSQKRTSLQLCPQFTFDDDSEKLFQLLRNKKEIMMHDHTHFIMQTTKFKSLLNDFQGRFKQIKTDRDQLQKKVNKYQYYFKQMRLKHVPDEDENNIDTLTNHQLKILNLQKKVQTLNYIIKQYRTNNNEQVKNFSQKLKQFRPNIEKQLTQKLAQANQKYERLLKKVEFFQSQCKAKLNVNWGELMDEFQETKKQNYKNLQYINQLKSKLQQLSNVTCQNKEKLTKICQLQEQSQQQRNQIQRLNEYKTQLQLVIQEKDKKIDQLNHIYEQTTFELQALQGLQIKIDNKQKTIKKNNAIINRLQFENLQLKSKIDSVLSQFQQKLFSQKNLQQSLLKANNDIHQLTNRLHETFLELQQNSSQATRQKEFFIGHMFEKIKSSYNEIIAEYQNQFKLINVESEKWKATFQLISKNQQQKIKRMEKINQEIKNIQDKKLRCQGHFNNLSTQALDQSNKPCINCSHFIAYWGQLQNSYNQLKKISTDIIEMESMSPLQQKMFQPTQIQEKVTLL